MELEKTIERLFEVPPEQINRSEVLGAVRQLKFFLNRGEVRAAECVDGEWKANGWVKKGILLAFRIGALRDHPQAGPFQYFDKDTMAIRRLTVEDAVRVVPGGTAIRDGAYIGRGVVVMPPAYINIGAYVGDETMIDSHALVGSCAQVGKRVHLSAAAQIGGVLEPIGALPVIIEDDVLIGGNCGVYEGTLVRRGAVLASGVMLTGSTPVYDIVHHRIHRREGSRPLTIPENAVVVSGTRPIASDWASAQHLSLYAPVIIKYRDDKTDAATALEESLR
jgi:2,3,4,5-tetrahydropyridine-2-carboxylate N-succinyltransferase